MENNIGYIEYIHSKTFEYFKQGNLRQGLPLYNMLFEPKTTLAMLEYNNETNGVSYMQSNMKKFLKYHKKHWDNDDLKDKTLLIYNRRCGFGDMIMNARYIQMLPQNEGKIIIEVNEGLIDFYRYNFPNCEVMEEYKGESDYTLPQELLLNLQKNLDKIPYSEGYLRADTKLVEKYKTIFNTNKIKVGIFSSSNDPDRSVPAQLMRGIFANEQCQFYCLVLGDPLDEMAELHKEYNVIELKQHIMNANDTAALIKNMDLVISIDSFPIHLAGALGVKSYLMLNHDSDWRWFNDTQTTPWYDSVKIFKQKRPYDWSDVINDITNSLNKE